jgi:PAS domain S-box-containing protein
MLTDSFVQRIQLMQGRLNSLCQHANAPQTQPDLLPTALKELGIASEEIQATLEELHRQNAELLNLRKTLEEERRRYKQLFELAPHNYVIVDLAGKIQEANQAIAKLLNVPQRFLSGKPFEIFLGEAHRQTFWHKFSQLQGMEQMQEWTIHLCPRDRQPVKVTVTASVSTNDRTGQPIAVLLSLREIGDPSRQLYLHDKIEPHTGERSPFEPDFSQKQIYLKGETIQLKPETVWLVCRGIVKLTTVCETGEEVLLGLTGAGSPFSGLDLDAAGICKATALTEVELTCFSWSEITADPALAQKLLPKINQRLQQTTALLAISGKRHVKYRLYYLLLLLSQQVGQPTERGTRLSVRLTHSDLASACSTTRVTITRMLGKMQAEGKIELDSKNHIIVCHERAAANRKMLFEL